MYLRHPHLLRDVPPQEDKIDKASGSKKIEKVQL